MKAGSGEKRDLVVAWWGLAAGCWLLAAGWGMTGGTATFLPKRWFRINLKNITINILPSALPMTSSRCRMGLFMTKHIALCLIRDFRRSAFVRGGGQGGASYSRNWRVEILS